MLVASWHVNTCVGHVCTSCINLWMWAWVCNCFKQPHFVISSCTTIGQWETICCVTSVQHCSKACAVVILPLYTTAARHAPSSSRYQRLYTYGPQLQFTESEGFCILWIFAQMWHACTVQVHLFGCTYRSACRCFFTECVYRHHIRCLDELQAEPHCWAVQVTHCLAPAKVILGFKQFGTSVHVQQCRTIMQEVPMHIIRLSRHAYTLKRQTSNQPWLHKSIVQLIHPNHMNYGAPFTGTTYGLHEVSIN